MDGGALVIGDFLLDTIANESTVVLVTDNSIDDYFPDWEPA